MQWVAAPVTHSHSAHRFFDGPREEGRGVGRVGESAEPTSDFLCRLAHYVELVFVWPLIEMAKLVGFYWLTPALFHNPKKYAMAFLGTHWLDSLIISNMKTAFVW